MRITKNAKTAIVLAVLILITIYCIFLELAGASGTTYSFSEVWDAIIGNGDTSRPEIWARNKIIGEINAPRLVIGLAVGAGLAIAGASMQAVFRNPLASPYILGLASGASVGAALSLLFTIPLIPVIIITPVLAFATCFATMILVYMMSRVGGVVRTESLILSGVAVSSLLSAIVSFLTFIAGDKMDGIVFWTMGNLGNVSGSTGWNEIFFAVPIILLCSFLLITQAKQLNAMMIGDAHAMDLGIDVRKTRLFVLIMSTMIVAAAVSFVGVIGFIGLVIPHILRILLGPDNRRILPLSMLGGACFIIICDYLAQIIAPTYGTLPIGVATSLIGAPVFIYLLIRRRKEVGWN